MLSELSDVVDSQLPEDCVESCGKTELLAANVGSLSGPRVRSSPERQ